MSRADRERWDQKWGKGGAEARPPDWLVSHAQLLEGGVALDLATGRGGAAHWLATHGYRVIAVDGSRVALLQARGLGHRSASEPPQFVQADLDEWRLPRDSVDLITVFRFLDRAWFPLIRQALRPGGLLIYETRTVGCLEHEPDATPEFLLRRGELLYLAWGWQVLSYLETTVKAALVARRPQ